MDTACNHTLRSGIDLSTYKNHNTKKIAVNPHFVAVTHVTAVGVRNDEQEEGFVVFHEEFSRVEAPYAVGLWIIVVALIKIGFHKATWVNKFLPESSILIICGLLIGLFFFFVAPEDKRPVTLTPDIFFIFLLPPIIGEAGYFMPNRLFFDQLGTILLMAVVGTIFNMFTIGGFLYAVGLTGLFQTETDAVCEAASALDQIHPGCNPGLLETFLFGSLIAAVDPVAVLAV